ncbi:hypothetical protein QOZ80_5BG0445740 [Eleusine coracana subsp. coracana]|nr:hypothetical protein QOZ80_5BG0445740 [Eleusine coracana subsp. coracana]
MHYWIMCNAAYRVRYGDRIIFTTPLHGSFYYVLRYKGQYVVFLIIARLAWLIGFCNAYGFYQVESKEIKGRYMDSAHTTDLNFDGNHKAITPGGTGNVTVNLRTVQHVFDILCDYQGSTSNPDFQPCLGFMVVFLMESKNRVIFNRNCMSILYNTDISLGNDWIKRAITNWKSVSRQGLQSLDDPDYLPHNCGLEVFQFLEQVLGLFYYLHVDAYFDGMFQHKLMDPPPRSLTWDPVDRGDGDGDIHMLEEPGAPNSGSIRNRKRASDGKAGSLNERKNKKPRGLQGGGLGGEPAAPEIFQLWARSPHNDKTICDDLVSHLNTMGLNVLDAKRKPGPWPLMPLGKKPKRPESVEKCISAGSKEPEGAEGVSKEKQKYAGSKELKGTETVQKENTGLRPQEGSFKKPISANVSSSSSVAAKTKTLKAVLPVAEISSLSLGECITDAIINMDFVRLTAHLRSRKINDVHLVPPTTSMVLRHEKPNAVYIYQALNLPASRMILLPVNDNTEFSTSGAGKHWSLLVIDLWTWHGPRFIHYDSARNFNAKIAYELANVLCHCLPANTRFEDADTPQQVNNTDCGLYVIEIARYICAWCEAHFGADSDRDLEDWSHMLKDIDAESISNLRSSLKQAAQGHDENPP